MNQNWHGTLIRHMLLLVTGCLLFGLISGYYGWSLAIGLGLYLGWTLKLGFGHMSDISEYGK